MLKNCRFVREVSVFCFSLEAAFWTHVRTESGKFWGLIFGPEAVKATGDLYNFFIPVQIFLPVGFRENSSALNGWNMIPR